jgi:hypothetical protein
MDLDHVRSEIEHMRVRVGRQRKEIPQLQEQGSPIKERVLGGRSW